MKDHKKFLKVIYTSDLAMPLSEVISYLNAISEGVVDPELRKTGGYDYVEFELTGWVPMTEKEIKQAKESKKREREHLKAAKEQARQQEIKLMNDLAEKYGYEVKNAASSESPNS